ncbi:amino acid adenylation domain-containing protein [Streptomyces sp. G-G2]|uniref:non-ribosomal peptide synthetase n=1 Tax=Streptomyces sp. G-G2 TaxID=3046201 RepID=UPI0024BA16A5|nr:amino acid adenylation domain-containing protein [Streptomyces sp. G-G2]MDJ0382297.1 amino acid adenylation domain-containing protein [Streptomyces sp. G-G2]
MTTTGTPQRLIPRSVPPTRTPDGAPAPTAWAELTVPVPVRLAARVRLLARRADADWAAAPLAAHTVVLAALSGERTVVSGYVPPAAAGSAAAAPRPLTLSLGAGTPRELLATAAQAAAAPAGGAFETVLDLGHTDGDPAAADRHTVLITTLRYGPQGPSLLLRHRTDVLDAEAAARIAGYYVTSLEQLVAAPGAPGRDRGLLGEAEYRLQIHGLGGTARELPDRRFHELFEEQAAARPAETAAVHAGRSWTYAELNARANRIAHAVLARELGAEAVVAVVTERNLDWLASVIGIFKAGAAYLPVEPHAPADRMARTLVRAGCRLVLTEEGGPGHLEQAAPAELELLDVTDAYAQGHGEDNPGVPVAADQLAYLYFTSGSTGEPKGAMCEHAGFVNHLYAKIDDQGIGEGQVVAQTAPQSFDISLWQLVAALVVGGRTLIVGQDAILDVDRYLDTIEQGEVAVLQAVPSYLEVVLTRLDDAPRELAALRCVSVTGEALKKELAVRWFERFPHIALMNAYGLTETSDDTNHEVMTSVPVWDSVPLGRAVGNVTVYIVDEDLRPVPLGAPGEIVFSGVCVGRGYVNDPERTAQVFGEDPHRPGQRLYRSGDFGRWLPGGTLEFLGRRDAQIKIRGFRIEIGEIENQLLKLPGVRDGAVVVVATPDGSRHLVGFQSGSDEDPDTLRLRLKETLPVYMVPGRLECLDALPLTPNGKTDKRALSVLAAELVTGEDERAHEELVTDTERELARAWSAVLKVPVGKLGRGDSFFDRGGTSLSGVRLVVRMERAFTLKDLMLHPTLGALAALIDSGAAGTAASPGADSGSAAPGAHSAPATAPATTAAAAATADARAVPYEVTRTEGRPAVLTLDGPAPADPAAWAAAHRARLRATVAEHGALLVRGLGLADARAVAAVSREVLHEVMTEREGFAVRRRLADGVYSSSEWPADQPMCMHHELSYAREVPGTLLFACLTAPDSGGITGVADSADVLEALPAGLVSRFETQGWRLDRNYTDTVGVSLADAFGTADRAAVEAYCARRGITSSWQQGGDLRTSQRAAAVLTHPLTGRRGWFNQIAFLNEWTLDPLIREYLTFEFGDDGLPFNSTYGSGAHLDEDTVLAINAVYEKHTLREPWRAGDLLIVDNLRMAHSREPYEGNREIAVVLGDPVTLPNHP